MNLEELKSEAMKIASEAERVKFVMEYFFGTVQYDYACLLAGGYARGTIKAVSENFKIIKFGLDNPDISEFALKREIVDGESKIFDEMMQLKGESQGSYEVFKAKLVAYIKEQLKTHLDNDVVIEQSADFLMRKIEEDLKRKNISCQLKNGVRMLINYDISSVLLDYILDPNAEFQPEIKDGLIVRGVCEDFSKNIIPILESIGIEAHKTDGISEFGHSWIIVKTEDGYRSVDLTRALFIKDEFHGIPKEQTPADWLYTDLGKMFDMQQTRQIIEIDGITLPEIITARNYTPEIFESAIQRVNASRSPKVNVEENPGDKITRHKRNKAEDMEF